MASSKEFGDSGEERGALYLESQGYQILKRNQRTPYGEIDIIAQKNNVIVIVEVKARSSDFFGSPESAVNFKKQEKIRQSALWWIQESGNHNKEIRFDVLGILRRRKEEWEINHWIGGFE